MESEPMLTPREKSPLPKMSPVEDRTRNAVDSEPKHYQLSYSGPRWHDLTREKSVTSGTGQGSHWNTDVAGMSQQGKLESDSRVSLPRDTLLTMCPPPSFSVIDSCAGQIFSPVDATKPAIR